MKGGWTGPAVAATGWLVLAGCHHGGLRTSIVRSNFIFQATVQEVGGSRLPDYLQSSQGDTLVVRVDRALTAAFQEFEGQTVTASLVRDSPVRGRSVRVGQTLVLLANPLVYGDTLTVEAEARKPSPELERQTGQRPQFLLEDRVRLAEVIVEGTVRAIKIVPREKRSGEFEHDPEWRQATVIARSVIRGGDLREVDIYFPASRDLVWYGAPQFRVGQSGTWLLHHAELEGRRERALVALNPLDFQPGGTQSEAIRAAARSHPYRPGKAGVEQREEEKER